MLPGSWVWASSSSGALGQNFCVITRGCCVHILAQVRQRCLCSFICCSILAHKELELPWKVKSFKSYVTQGVNEVLVEMKFGVFFSERNIFLEFSVCCFVKKNQNQKPILWRCFTLVSQMLWKVQLLVWCCCQRNVFAQQVQTKVDEELGFRLCGQNFSVVVV